MAGAPLSADASAGVKSPAYFAAYDVPNGSRVVIADQERAVLRCGNANGTAPHSPIRGNEAGEKILIDAGGLAPRSRGARVFAGKFVSLYSSRGGRRRPARLLWAMGPKIRAEAIRGFR